MANDELVFVCIQCGHGCSSYEDLTSHMEDHEDQKPDIRQLRKSTVFSKNKFSGKAGKGYKRANNCINDEFKTEAGDIHSRNYSYPSYISIGTNKLDGIDPTWSQGNSFEDVHANEVNSVERAGQATKGGAKSKQAQSKLASNKQTNKQLPSKQLPSKQAGGKQVSNKQTVNKQGTGKQTTAKQTEMQRVPPGLSSQAQKSRAVVNGKKQLAISVSNKRKSTTDLASSVKNAKLKKKESKKQRLEKQAQDFRRRSTNSMRLRKLTSAGEICHDDSSESMSESERLAEAIRRSKIETSMSSIVEKSKNDKTLNELVRTRSRVQVMGKPKEGRSVQGIVEHLAESKAKSTAAVKRSTFNNKNDHFIGPSKEHLVGHFKTTAKKLKKSLRLKKDSPVLSAEKQASCNNRTSKSQVQPKRLVTTTSKAATTLLGKIIPIQAPMIWKLVNSAQQQKSDTIDLKKIQNMKNNATLKFTGEQKVLITFNQNSEGQNSTAVKTIIANVTSPSRGSPKSSSGVKTRQAVLLPISAAGDSPIATESENATNGNTASQPMRILRSNNKSIPSNLSNYSIIPLSSLIASSAIVSAIPHLLSAAHRNVKISPETRVTTTTQKPIAFPAQTQPIASIQSTENPSTSSLQVPTPVKLIVVTSVPSAPTTNTVSASGIVTSIHAVPTSLTVTTTPTAPGSLSTPSTSVTSKQAFLPQSSKTLIIKHSSNSSQVFTLIPTVGQHLLSCSGTPIAPRTTITGTSNATSQSQLIRPIFITAQPNAIPQKPAAVSNKPATSNTSPQAVFIAAGHINQGGNPPVSGIQLTLSPSKSLFAGAIPIIVGSQVNRSSAANLSSQIQLTLSSLQSQNLVVTSSVKSQQPVISITAASSASSVAVCAASSVAVCAASTVAVCAASVGSVSVQPASSSVATLRPKPAILRRSTASSKVEIPVTSSTVARKITFSEAGTTTKGLVIREPPLIMTPCVAVNTAETVPSGVKEPLVATSISSQSVLLNKAGHSDVGPGGDASPEEQALPDLLYTAVQEKNLSASTEEGRVVKPLELVETIPGPEILEYLPTLPGACTTSLTSPRKSTAKERLIVKVLLSKLKRRPTAVKNPSLGSFSVKDSIIRPGTLPEKDLADIKEIIKHTASFDLPRAPIQTSTGNQLGIASIAPVNTILSQPVFHVSQALNPVRTFVEIRPAISQPLILANALSLATSKSVTPTLGPSLSVVNTPALTTPIVTPVVTSASLHQISRPMQTEVTFSGAQGKNPEKLPVSIKLASIASGSRLKMTRPVNTAPNPVPVPFAIKPAASGPIQAPLLPRPTQGFLTVLAPKPTGTIANQQQISANAPGTVQRFPVTYLTTLPLQLGNRPRTQVMIHPAPRAIFTAPSASTTQTPAVNTVRIGTQTMVIPVSLSFPGVNLQQVPVSSNVLLPSLYSVVSTSGVSQSKPSVQVVPSQALLPPSTAAPPTRLQKIAPHPPATVSKLVIGKTVTSLPKPTSVKVQTITSVGRDNATDTSLRSGNIPPDQDPSTSIIPAASVAVDANQHTPPGGGFSVKESSVKVIPEVSRPSVIAALPSGKADQATSAKANQGVPMTSSEVKASNSSSVPLSATVALAGAIQGMEAGSKDPNDSSPRDCITDLTNSLRSLLKTDIKEGSTVTINIQGSPVTYALKDGKLFSMPHDLPTKKESKDSRPKSNAEKVVPASATSTSQTTSGTLPQSSGVTSSVAFSTGTNVSSANTAPLISSVVKPNIIARRKSDFPVPCSQLRVSVPKSLLFRKVGATRSVSTGSANFVTSEQNYGDCRPFSAAERQNDVTTTENTRFDVSMPTSHVNSLPNDVEIRNRTSKGTGNPSAYKRENQEMRLEEANTVSENSGDTNRKRTAPDNVDLMFGFECDFCSQKFVSYNLMWRHRKLHLNDTANFTKVRRTSLPPPLCPKLAYCELCDRFFESLASLEQHKQMNNCLAPESFFNVSNATTSKSINTAIVSGNHRSHAAAFYRSTSEPVYNQVNARNDDPNASIFSNAMSPEFGQSRDDGIIRNDVICRIEAMPRNDIIVRNEAINRIEFNSRNEVTDTTDIRSPLTMETLDDMSSLNSLVQFEECENSDRSEPNVSEILSELTNDLIGSTTPNNDDSMDDVMDGFDLNANFDDQVFEDSIDVKTELKPAKRLRRISGKSVAPRKRIIQRKYSNIGKTFNNAKRTKRRSRVTESDDEEALDDAGVDLDGEFITVGKLHGEFTCSRCDQGFQNEKELDDHNETFHDSLRYNFRERRSVSNLGYLDDFEFEMD